MKRILITIDAGETTCGAACPCTRTKYDRGPMRYVHYCDAFRKPLSDARLVAQRLPECLEAEHAASALDAVAVLHAVRTGAR